MKRPELMSSCNRVILMNGILGPSKNVVGWRNKFFDIYPSGQNYVGRRTFLSGHRLHMLHPNLSLHFIPRAFTHTHANTHSLELTHLHTLTSHAHTHPFCTCPHQFFLWYDCISNSFFSSSSETFCDPKVFSDSRLLSPTLSPWSSCSFQSLSLSLSQSQTHTHTHTHMHTHTHSHTRTHTHTHAPTPTHCWRSKFRILLPPFFNSFPCFNFIRYVLHKPIVFNVVDVVVVVVDVVVDVIFCRRSSLAVFLASNKFPTFIFSREELNGGGF